MSWEAAFTRTSRETIDLQLDVIGSNIKDEQGNYRSAAGCRGKWRSQERGGKLKIWSWMSWEAGLRIVTHSICPP